MSIAVGTPARVGKLLAEGTSSLLTRLLSVFGYIDGVQVLSRSRKIPSSCLTLDTKIAVRCCFLIVSVSVEADERCRDENNPHSS